MVESIGESRIINQTIFKTKEKYGFDSFIFPNDVPTLTENYINFIQPCLNSCCDYVGMVSRFGNKESAEKLTSDNQACLSEDQKHMLNVVKIHYQKLTLENIAMEAKSCLEQLQDSRKSSEQLAAVNKAIHSSNKIDFEKGELTKKAKVTTEKRGFFR